MILEMHVKFPNCWNREDASNPANWDLASEASWFYSFCQERATFPNIEYVIMYPVEEGKTTEGWYLSSDVDPMTLARGVDAGWSVQTQVLFSCPRPAS